jgi:hypothetical protein
MRIHEICLILLIYFAGSLQLAGQDAVNAFDRIVLKDDFSGYSPGLLSPPVGPHTEYHFLKEVQPTGKWRVTSFYHNPHGADTAWRIESFKGNNAICIKPGEIRSSTIPTINLQFHCRKPNKDREFHLANKST